MIFMIVYLFQASSFRVDSWQTPTILIEMKLAIKAIAAHPASLVPALVIESSDKNKQYLINAPSQTQRYLA